MKSRALPVLVMLWAACFAQPSLAATQQVTANIEFADVIQVSTDSDSGGRNLSLPVLITVNNFGSTYFSQSGKVYDKDHDTVKFTGPKDQVMNFLTLAYSDGVSALTPIKSVCSQQGDGGDGCDKLYGSIQSEHGNSAESISTVFLTNLAPSASKNSKLSLFDLCAVYQ